MADTIQMMGPDCSRAVALLPLWADAELGADEARWLEAHLAGCTECSASLEAVAEFDVHADTWRRQLRDPQDEGARARLEEQLSSPSRRFAWPRIVVPVAIAAGIAVAALLLRYGIGGASRGGLAAKVQASEAFAAIPYLPPLDPRENTTVVRMNLRVGTLISAGYRVNGDPNAIVPADVLVGEDGQAHGVRLAEGVLAIE